MVLYGIERGLDNVKSFVSYFFDGTRLSTFREPFTCKYNIYSIDKLTAFSGSLVCIDRMARLNILSLKSPNERPHFAPLYPAMEITGTPEREKLIDLQEMRLSSAKKTNKKRVLAQDQFSANANPEKSEISITNLIYKNTDPQLHGKQNLLAMSTNSSYDNQGNFDPEKISIDMSFGVCVNNDGMLKGVVLRYTNQIIDGQASGTGFNYVCETISGIKFPSDYPEKKYFRDVVYSAVNSTFYVYDDKNKAVLSLEWPENLVEAPRAVDLKIQQIGDLRGTVTFGNIIKVSPNGSRVYGYEGGDYIRIFYLGRRTQFDLDVGSLICSFEGLSFERLATLNSDGEIKIFDEEGLELDTLDIFSSSQNPRTKQEHMKIMACSQDSTNIAVVSFTSANRPSRIFWLQIDDESHIYLVSELDMTGEEDFDVKCLCFVPNRQSLSCNSERIETAVFTLTGKLESCSSPLKQAPLIKLNKKYPSSQPYLAAVSVNSKKLVPYYLHETTKEILVLKEKVEQYHVDDFLSKVVLGDGSIWSMSKTGSVSRVTIF